MSNNSNNSNNSVAILPECDNQFYPTPEHLALKMLEYVDFSKIKTMLEPSAGKGDLAVAAVKEFISRKTNFDREYRFLSNMKFPKLDLIEIDPNLRGILTERLASKERGRRRDTLYKEYKDAVREDEDLEKEAKLYEEYKFADTIAETEICISSGDFLTFNQTTKYDLVLMNPPFADADKHLLKAIELQERYGGGQIVCLLNAETVRNPFSNTRKALSVKLAEYSAGTEIIENAFSDAERKADVDCVIVNIAIPEASEESEIWEKMKKAEEAKYTDPETKQIVIGDYIDQAIAMFNVEVNSGAELIRQYKLLKPHMTTEIGENQYPQYTLELHLNGRGDNFDTNDYMKKIRLKYWKALFSNPKFTGKLPSSLASEYQSRVNDMVSYDFCRENIEIIACEMTEKLNEGVYKTIDDLFNKFTSEHTWYPEFSSNIHYYNGWATNKAHMVNRDKVIIPGNMFARYRSNNNLLDTYSLNSCLLDIEKVFDFLDCGRTFAFPDKTVKAVLTASRDGVSKNIETKYFALTLYKKGTMHLKFNDDAKRLIDKMNIIAAKGRAWLPPYYGKKRYEDMDSDGKAVIDEFQGREAYNKVLADADFYLAEPTSELKMIEAA